MPTIAAFMRTYPEISLNLDFTDPLVDVIEEGFDSIVRTGEVRDYATYEPEPRTSRQKVVASPDNSKKKARRRFQKTALFFDVFITDTPILEIGKIGSDSFKCFSSKGRSAIIIFVSDTRARLEKSDSSFSQLIR